MDPSAFDQISRAVGRFIPRRTALVGLTGALTAFGSRLASGRAPDVRARPDICRPLGKPCFPNRGLTCCRGATCQDGRCQCPVGRKRCGQRCLPKRKCCRHRDCPANQRCQQGRCQCPGGRKRCGKRCIPRTACCRNGECGAHEACVGGSCRCANNAKRCGETCILDDLCCDNGDCAGYQICQDHVCVDKPCGDGGPCRVFVTAGTRDGAMGGAAGADTICQTAANGSARTQGGTYKAWISDDTEESAPANRFTNLANTGPYMLVNDARTVVANDWADLTALKGGGNYLRAPINVTESGDVVPPSQIAWTNVTPAGTRQSEDDRDNCLDWSVASSSIYGNYGVPRDTVAAWTYRSSGICGNNSGSLYCFEQG